MQRALSRNRCSLLSPKMFYIYLQKPKTNYLYDLLWKKFSAGYDWKFSPIHRLDNDKIPRSFLSKKVSPNEANLKRGKNKDQAQRYIDVNVGDELLTLGR